jgi:SAM-dependent methyltransferase
MLLRAKERSGAPAQKPLIFARATAQSLPIADGEAGAVNCFGALHLFPDPRGAIAEVGRVLRSKGTFTALTAGTAAGRSARIAQSLFGRIATFRFFEDEQIAAWLEAANLEVVNLSRVGMAILVAAKKR